MAANDLAFCPAGFRLNGTCYCTKEEIDLYPQLCDVECAKVIHGFDPSGGRCQCLGDFAGLRCDRYVCHYTPSAYYDEMYYQLFCLDNYNSTNDDYANISVNNCTGVVNLGNRTPKMFPMCPCLNEGYRAKESPNATCLCTKGYYGDLCQHWAKYDLPSPWGTVGVAAFIVAVFAVIGLALLYRKNKRKKYYAKMYQLEPVNEEGMDVFGGMPPPSPPPPPPQARKSRRQTLADLFHGRRRKLTGTTGQTGQAPKGPTVYQGADQSSMQPQDAGLYEDTFGTAPQNYSGGIGM